MQFILDHATTSLWVLFSTMLIWALNRMIRHSVLLTGYLVNQAQNGQSLYRFFIQNLEDVEFESEVSITLTALNSKEPITSDDINIFSGPREVQWLQLNTDALCLRLRSLPAFDTWRIDILSSAPVLCLEIAPTNIAQLFNRNIIKALEPRQLKLASDDAKLARVFAGATRMPNNPFAFLFGAAGLCAYLAYAVQTGLFFESGRYVDMIFMAALATVTIIGYLLIQRPVYPVIQGYLDPSPLRPGPA